MAGRTSELRDMVRKADPEPRTSAMTYVAFALVVLIPAATIYAWRSGMINAAALRHAPVLTEQPIPMAAAARVETLAQSSAAPPPQTKAAAPQGSVPPLRMSKLDVVSTVVKFHMHADVFEEFAGTMMDMMNDADSNKKPVSTDDLFAWCRAQTADKAPALVRQKRSEAEQERILFDTMAANVLCIMQRPQVRLCEKKTRERLVRQIKLYSVSRQETLAAASPVMRKSLEDLFGQGMHKSISSELASLGRKGIVSVSDFGRAGTQLTSEVLTPLKGVKSACGG